MTKFEFDPSKLVINDVDLSGYVSNAELSHDADEKGTWGEKIAGLQESSLSMTFDNTSGYFEPATLAAFFPPPPPLMTATYAVPDGRWQSWKHRLRLRWPRLLKWLKVRYINYSFTGYVEQWQDNSGFTLADAVGPITKGTETR